MDKLNSIFKLVASILIVCLLIMGVIVLKPTAVLKKAAVWSVAAALPDGAYTFLLKENSNQTTFQEDTVLEQETQFDILQTQTNILDVGVKTEAVEQKVLGNIVKRTMSPYGANTKFGAVNISNKTGVDIDIEKALKTPLSFDVEKSQQPQILIYHTHATEAFMNDESEYYTNRDEPRSTDTNVNIVKIGEQIAKRLNNAGYTVIHDKTLHDHPGYSGSYSRSLETIKTTLKKYPSIKIAIDIHRDSISSGKSDKVAPVVMVDGKEAAQVMLVMGSETGTITDYPNWRDNLQLAIKLQSIFETKYPQFARSVLLKSAKYNQNVLKGSFLIEIGSDANTLKQALYSAELVSNSLITLLNSN